MCYISIYLCFFFALDMHLYLLHHLLCIVTHHFDGWTIILPIKYIFKRIQIFTVVIEFFICFYITYIIVYFKIQAIKIKL